MSARSTAKASVEGLEKVKRAIAQKGWRKTSPVLLDAACVSAATIKRFWRGIPVSQESFQSICRAVNLSIAEVIEVEEAELEETNANAYSGLWVGREALVNKLSAQLRGDTRLLSIVGIAGIGKTELARYLAGSLTAEGYNCIHLNCDSTTPPTLASIAHALLKQSNQPGLNLSIPRLIEHLQQHKYLFIIDALESLLLDDVVTGYSRFKNPLWRVFFQSILAADSCSSRFIFTSQSIPNELETLGESWLGRSHTQVITGLSPTAQLDLFAQLGLFPLPNSAEHGYLTQIGLAYDGHPLALKAIAQDITTDFGNNIAAYWNECQSHIDSQRTEQITTLHSHSRALRRRLQPKLERSLLRLSTHIPLAYRLLYAGCVVGESSKLSHQWVQIAQQVCAEYKTGLLKTESPALLAEAGALIDVLSDRALLTPTVIDNRLYFSTHPLIRSLLLSRKAMAQDGSDSSDLRILSGISAPPKD